MIFCPSTAPSTSPVDVVQVRGADVAGAGTFGLEIRDEGGNLYRIGNGQIRTPDGTFAAPLLAPASTPTDGIYWAGVNHLRMRIGAVDALRVREVDLGIPATLGFNASSYTAADPDVFLTRDAANILAMRNGVSAQTFRGYGTFTDASNYERWALSATIGTGITLAAETAGTGGDNLGVTITPAGTGNVTTAIGAGGLFLVGPT